MKCGREPEGERVYELGICPASTDKTLNGKNGGAAAGRLQVHFAVVRYKDFLPQR